MCVVTGTPGVRLPARVGHDGQVKTVGAGDMDEKHYFSNSHVGLLKGRPFPANSGKFVFVLKINMSRDDKNSFNRKILVGISHIVVAQLDYISKHSVNLNLVVSDTEGLVSVIVNDKICRKITISDPEQS